MKGFTAIELLVAIGIFLLIIGAVFTFQNDIFSLHTMFQDTLFAQDEAREALKSIIKEVRSISTSDTGAYPIVDANSTSFTFYSNRDDDDLTERIRYFLDGTILKRGILKPTGNPLVYDPANETIKEVVKDIDNGVLPIFQYYDTLYNGVTPPLAEPVNILAIRLLAVTLTIDENPAEEPGPLVFTTQVSMRNLKDNL